MTIRRLIVDWNGGAGGPGFTILHTEFDGAADIPATNAAVEQFLTSIAGAFPSQYQYKLRSEWDHYSEATGDLTGSTLTGIANPTHSGGAANPVHAAGVGAVIDWATAGIVNGRRVRGKTYLIPQTVSAYESDGTMLASYAATYNDAAVAMIAALSAAGSPLVIWSRPFEAETTEQTSRVGTMHEVTGAATRDKVASLRGRRS